MMKKPFIIGVSGGSGTGKTYLIAKLRTYFSEEQLCVISQDEYYKPKMHQVIDEQGVPNFDLPSALDEGALVLDLQKLSEGATVYKTEYTFNNPDRIPKQLVVKPAQVLLIEGIFIFHYEHVNALLDFKVFLQTKKEVRLARRIKRDAKERGYSLDHVMYTDKHHVGPAYKSFIKPYRKEADVILPNNEAGFDKGVELIRLLIQKNLKE